jgi:predicted ATPase
MLTRLALTNFKSWAGTGDVRLAPLTGMFGTNSSGKTSLLQVLLLLKQTADSSDRGQALYFGDRTSPVDLGDFRTVVHGHDTSARLAIELDWNEPSRLEIKDPRRKSLLILRSSRLGFATSVAAANGGDTRPPRVRVEQMDYRAGKVHFGMALRDGKKDEYDLVTKGTEFEFRRTPGRPWPLPPPAKCYGFPDEARAYFQNAGFLADLELAFERRLRAVYYLGPLRAYPERQYPWSGARPEDMGRAGEQAINAILASRERGLLISLGKGKKRATLEEYVASWLRRLGLIHSFRVEAVAEGAQLYRVLVRKTPKAAEVLITDVGFGVSQVLPVLVLCFYVPEGSTVLLEQPEIHLHPSVQAGLADVFIDVWQKRRVQVLVESHSEHLLRRLQRRVAEEAVAPDDAALYFTSEEDGVSRLTTLEMDRFGNIKNWPEGFFGDEFGEIAAMSRAVQKRKKQGEG